MRVVVTSGFGVQDAAQCPERLLAHICCWLSARYKQTKDEREKDALCAAEDCIRFIVLPKGEKPSDSGGGYYSIETALSVKGM